MSHPLDPAVLHSFLEEVRSYLPALEQEAARLRAGAEAPGALAETLAAEGAEQFAYARGGKLARMGYWSLPEAALDDPEGITDLRNRRSRRAARQRCIPPAARSSAAPDRSDKRWCSREWNGIRNR